MAKFKHRRFFNNDERSVKKKRYFTLTFCLIYQVFLFSFSRYYYHGRSFKTTRKKKREQSKNLKKKPLGYRPILIAQKLIIALCKPFHPCCRRRRQHRRYTVVPSFRFIHTPRLFQPSKYLSFPREKRI